MDYFLSTLPENLSSEERQLFQAQLWQLVGKLAARYTMGDSSSLREETAQELTASVLFCLRTQLQPKPGVPPVWSMLKEVDLAELFQAGRQEVLRRVELGKRLLQLAQQGKLPLDNISYQETVQELASFFQHYDAYYLAQQIPCDIDYQLALPLADLEGIDYINEYLRRLIIENEFCAQFERRRIIALLRSYVPDYREQLINLFEPLFTNALGLMVLRQDPRQLGVNAANLDLLAEIFRQQGELTPFLQNTACRLGDCLALNSPRTRQYLANAAQDLSDRIQAQLANGLDLSGIFLELAAEQAARQDSTIYQDGQPMPDEDLRTLIDEMRACRHLADKMALIKQQVHSLRDLVELLQTCFWGEEFQAVYAMLQPAELRLLRQYAAGQTGIDLPDETAEWLQALKQYPKS